jgi:hypothetical protein
MTVPKEYPEPNRVTHRIGQHKVGVTIAAGVPVCIALGDRAKAFTNHMVRLWVQVAIAQHLPHMLKAVSVLQRCEHVFERSTIVKHAVSNKGRRMPAPDSYQSRSGRDQEENE